MHVHPTIILHSGMSRFGEEGSYFNSLRIFKWRLRTQISIRSHDVTVLSPYCLGVFARITLFCM